VDALTAERRDSKYPLGALLTEGKTKKIHQLEGSSELVALVSKDDITAGDGAKHDVIAGKARLATATTCNVFRLLKACGLPVAFEEQDSATSFVAPNCRMLPYEVVARREAHGSYLKRNPHVAKGQLFPRLILELYLKTKGKSWKGKPLVCDDPLLAYAKEASEIRLFHPAKPLAAQEPFLTLPQAEVFAHEDEWRLLPEMQRIASFAFLVLEKAWQLEGGTLVDLKVEFGFDDRGNLLLADVIDNDSWRVLESGSYIDKQVYREGGALGEVAAKYRRVAEITGRFRLPRQRIILWRGSETDNTDAFAQALADCVLIAYIGRSNGAGPTLSAISTIPVITVPATINDFPDDVWSSLRAPSRVPVMTVLQPANAILAALQILSARNPRLYAHVRQDIEARTINTIAI